MKSAFTLLEVLITIVVLLVLAGLALPGSARARQLASLSRCQSHDENWP
jgi:prepilin-type N-terminal cleavage/methylation domain-containing protein